MDPEGQFDPDYEPEVARVIENFVRPGDYCIDAGASIGFHTCLLAEKVGPKGRVMAFEPNGKSFGYLTENIASRGLQNVFAQKIALWSHDKAWLKLHSINKLGYTSVLEYNSTTYTEVVEARALDSVLPPGIQPNFIKIDCEMAEFEILRGAERTLRSGVDCVVLEFNFHLMRQNKMSDRVIREFLADLGYDMFLISISAEDGYVDPIRIPVETEIRIHGSLVNLNVMFSTEEKVRERWRICDTLRSFGISTENSKNSLLNIIENATALPIKEHSSRSAASRTRS